MQDKMKEISERKEDFLKNYLEKDQQCYREYADFVLGQIKSALRNRNIQIAYSSAREKAYDSLRKKCEKPKYDDPRNQIMDLAGVRLVTYLLQDVPLVQQVVEELFDVKREDSGDKLELLGANKIGYLSVHYIVTIKDDMLNAGNSKFRNRKCEVQIRTVLEDAWAQIFHDRQYKNTSTIGKSPALERRTNLISGSLELLDHNINELVVEYDSDQLLRAQNLDNLLNKSVTRDGLISYIDAKLDRKARFFDYQWIQEVLKSFGVQRIRELDDILENTHEEERIRTYSEPLTADQIIICILIVYDIDRFFQFAGKRFQISASAARFLSTKIAIRNACDKYGILIRD